MRTFYRWRSMAQNMLPVAIEPVKETMRTFS